MTTPKAPGNLGKSGRAFWGSTVRAFDLNPAELAALEECCRIKDLLARIDADLAEDLTCEGSVGQVRAHPLLRSRTDLTGQLDSLLRSLALPMAGEEEGRIGSPAAIAAARARWSRGQA